MINCIKGKFRFYACVIYKYNSLIVNGVNVIFIYISFKMIEMKEIESISTFDQSHE